MHPKPIQLLFLLCFMTSTCLFAQETFGVDYAKIEKESKDTNSPFYFPRLLERYLKADNSMTGQDKKYFYYGYSYTSGYTPMGIDHFRDSVNNIIKKEVLDENDYKLLLAYADSSLKRDPLNIRMLKYQQYAYQKTGSIALADANDVKINIIAGAIINSGDGKSTKTAFHVINVRDEYDIVRLMGLRSTGQRLVDDHFDVLSIEQNKHGIKELYFNVYRSMAQLEDMFKEDPPTLPTESSK